MHRGVRDGLVRCCYVEYDLLSTIIAPVVIPLPVDRSYLCRDVLPTEWGVDGRFVRRPRTGPTQSKQTTLIIHLQPPNNNNTLLGSVELVHPRSCGKWEDKKGCPARRLWIVSKLESEIGQLRVSSVNGRQYREHRRVVKFHHRGEGGFLLSIERVFCVLL